MMAGSVSKTFDPVVRVGKAEAEARREAEAERLAAIKAGALPPPELAATTAAPARGPMHIEREVGFVPGSNERVRTLGVYWARTDAFSAEIGQALRRHQSRNPDAPFVAPYTGGQMAVGRHYHALVERHSSAGMKCASLEAQVDRSGGQGGFADAFLAEGREIARLRAAIGPGCALRPQRHMDRGNARRAISTRALVDMFCLAGTDLSAILRSFGWVPNGHGRKELRAHLVAALDRMQGYD